MKRAECQRQKAVGVNRRRQFTTVVAHRLASVSRSPLATGARVTGRCVMRPSCVMRPLCPRRRRRPTSLAVSVGSATTAAIARRRARCGGDGRRRGSASANGSGSAGSGNARSGTCGARGSGRRGRSRRRLRRRRSRSGLRAASRANAPGHGERSPDTLQPGRYRSPHSTLQPGAIPEFLWYQTIPELWSILVTQYLRCEFDLYKLKLLIIIIREKIIKVV